MFDWILSVIQGFGLPGLAGLMILENVFPPIPSELVIPLAGFLSVVALGPDPRTERRARFRKVFGSVSGPGRIRPGRLSGHPVMPEIRRR